MRILAIDPGSKRSALVLYDPEAHAVRHGAIKLNHDVRMLLRHRLWVQHGDDLVIEMVASYGMPVGAEVFDTCLWIGRFIEAWGGPYTLMFRKTVCGIICGSARAKDSNVRQAVIDLFPRTGGGKRPQIGIKAKPGPLYGLRDDEWQALALALAYAREHYEEGRE